MNREHLEKLNGNPEWKAAFESALTRAETTNGENADSLAYALVAADLATDPEAIARSEEQAQAAANDAHVDRILANVRANPAPIAAAVPDPAERARAGWANAIRETNGEDPQ